MTATAPAVRTAPAPAAPPPAGAEALRLHDEGHYLLANIRWMVGLRWLAIAGMALGIVAADTIGWSAYFTAPAVTAAAHAASNLFVWLRHRRPAAHPDPLALRRQIVLHLHLDLVALALVVHWTGGVSNPFVMFFVFPAATGAILLGTRAALLIGSTAFLLFAAMVVCDIVAAVPRRPLAAHAGELLDHPTYVAALLVAGAITLFGAVYFLRTVVARHERAEEGRRNHERIALSRERMARVGMIAAGVAHSVRNPLHGVLNCLELVRDAASPAEAHETLALMQEGLSRIEHVTARLLSLSRDTPLAPRPTDLDQLVLDTLRLVEVGFGKHGVAVRTDLGGLRDVRLDPLRIQEALFNILDNARAAVADAGPADRWVAVRTAWVDQPFAGACLEVADPGIGVDEQAIAHVFDPFFSTKPVGEGTGLGLAIAKEVVEAHGGVIQFLSRRNAGTKVRILIPSDASAPPAGGAA